MRSWLTDERLRVYPLLVLGMLVCGFVALLTAPYGIGKGGDFVSFYSAGEIVGSGRAASLYDWSTQKAVQSATAPGSLTGMLPFAYPPFVALAYVPLSKLDYRLAYALHTVGMVLIVYLAVVLLLPVFRRIGSQPLAATVALLAFYPLSRGVLGQTTAVSVLLISVAWRCLHDERDIWAGAAVGLLLFKPQLALPVIGLAGLLRRPRMLIGFAGVAGLLHCAGAAVSGWGWLPDWWSHLAAFQQATQRVDTSQSISILGFAEALIGPRSPAAMVIGALLSAALAVFLGLTWFRARESLNLRMAMTCCGVVLIPPHSLYYDAGIAGLGLLALVDERGWEDARWIAAFYLAAYLTPLSAMIGFSPMFPLVVAILVRLGALSAATDTVPDRGNAGAKF